MTGPQAASPTGRPSDRVRLSVVIPCRDAAGTLGRQLAALAAQEYAGSWEVVVADNGSTDDTLDVASSWAGALPALRVVDATGQPGASFAYNTGAAAARGSRLLFCDADDEVAPGWLAAMDAALRRHEVVAGRLVPLVDSDNGPPLPRDVPQQQGLQSGPAPIHLPCAASCNLGVRRSAFDRVGGFCEDLPVLGDTDLCWRLQQSGSDIVFEPAALVHYRLRPRGRATFVQAASYGDGEVRLQARHRPHGWSRPVWGAYLARSVASPLAVVARAAISGRSDRAAQLTWQLGWRYGRARGLWAHRRDLTAQGRLSREIAPRGCVG